jgi:hypothetical protein
MAWLAQHMGFLGCSNGKKKKKRGEQNVNISEFWACQLIFFHVVHPHTLTALIVLLALMFYAATRSNYENTADSIKLGVLASVACFVFIGMLHFPDGPFVRPSKPIWRAVLSLSVLYQLFLVFLLFMVSLNNENVICVII